MPKTSERHRLIRVSLALAGVTLFVRLLGGVLQIVIAAKFGASGELDAYLVAVSLPNIVSEWFVLAAPAVVLVPLLVELRHDGLDDEAWRLICTFANVLLVVVLVMIAIAFVAGGGIIGVLAPGLDPSRRDLSSSLLRWTSLLLIPACGSGVMRALLHSHDRFLAPALAMTLSTATAIAVVVVASPGLGVKAIVAGLLSGAGVALVVNAVSSRGLWRRWYVGTDVRRAAARRSMSLLATYLLVGMAAQINFLSDRFFASYLDPGSISVLEYGEKLAAFAMLVFASAIAVPAYTSFSRHAAARDVAELRDTVFSSTRLVAVVTIPMLAIAIVLRVPIVRFLLQHGVFTAEDGARVATVFAILCIVWCIYAFAQVLTYAFFALQDTWRFLLMVIASIALNIALDVVLVGPLGVTGLAIATATATAASNLVLWGMLGSRLGGIDTGTLVPFAARVGAASLVAGGIAWAANELLAPRLDVAVFAGQFASLAVPAALAALVYVVVCRAARVEEIGQIWRSLTRKT